MGKRGRPPHPDILTPREWQVLDLIRQDLTNEQIAHRLDISPATAKYHVSEILSKLNVTTREQAAGWQPDAATAVRWWQRALAPLAVRRLGPINLVKGTIGATALATAALLVAALGLLLANTLGSEGEDDRSGAVAARRFPDRTSGHVLFRASTRQAIPSATLSPTAGVQVSVLTATPTAADPPSPPTTLSTPSVTPTPTAVTLAQSIVIVGLPGGDRVVAQGSDPQWSPNGEWIAYLSGKSGPGSYAPEYALNVVRVDGAGAREFEAIVQRSDALPYQCINRLFSWSPTSDRLLFCNGGKLYTLAIDGSEPPQPILDAFYFSLSPDGRRVAYGTSGGLPGEIRIRDLITGDDQNLTEGFEPTWSNDGRYLSYSSPAFASPGFSVIDISTGAITHYEQDSGWSFNTAWSPVNNEIAYSKQGSIYVVDIAATGAPRFLAQGYSPTWSPDGRSLAYGMGVNCSDVYTIAADGSGAPQKIGTGRSPTWSPTGAGIAVVKDQLACET